AELRVTLADQTVDDIIIRGLHEYMQWIQTQISKVQQETAQAFWPVTPHCGTPPVQVQQ
ncbi:MAG: alpha-E domain-containing protein, partial [Acetobacter malorum]